MYFKYAFTTFYVKFNGVLMKLIRVLTENISQSLFVK